MRTVLSRDGREVFFAAGQGVVETQSGQWQCRVGANGATSGTAAGSVDLGRSAARTCACDRSKLRRPPRNSNVDRRRRRRPCATRAATASSQPCARRRASGARSPRYSATRWLRIRRATARKSRLGGHATAAAPCVGAATVRRLSHGRFYSEMRPNSRRARPAVGVDLRAQGVDVGKRPLVAEPLDEREPHARAVEIAVDVEQVRLDRGPIDVAERRPQADVRHRRVDDAVDRHGRGIDARRRQQLVVGLRGSPWGSRSRGRGRRRATTVPSMK